MPTTRLLALLVTCSLSNVFAAQLVRGPYLQNGTPTSVTIKWRTAQPTNGFLRYGDGRASLALSARNAAPTTDHEITLSGLTPDTKYFYSVGAADEDALGAETFYFRTLPIAGPPRPTRIWAIGDCGTASVGSFGSLQVRDAYYRFAGTNHTDVWLMLGDNAYFSGTDSEYQAAVFNVYQHMLRNTMLWSTLGNHETYGPDQEGRIAYHSIFTLPTRGEAGGIASGTENYYSFDFANIHFVCLDSEISDPTNNSPMWTWLEADLAANTKDWLIAFWHSPPYTKGSHDSDNMLDSAGRMTFMRTNFVSLLEYYDVDLVLSGHSHNYERSFLINGHYGFSPSLTPEMIKDEGSGRVSETGAYLKPAGRRENEGAVYVVAGSSGWATGLQPRAHPAMFITLLRMGSMVIDIDGNRLEAKFLRETGEIDDQFTIIKGGLPAPFRMVTTKMNGDKVVARWKSQAGKTYQVESATILQSPNWAPVGDPVRAYGATTSWTNPVVDPQNFYRVREAAVP